MIATMSGLKREKVNMLGDDRLGLPSTPPTQATHSVATLGSFRCQATERVNQRILN